MTDAELMIATAFRGDLLQYQRNVTRAERAAGHEVQCQQLEAAAAPRPHVNFNGLG